MDIWEKNENLEKIVDLEFFKMSKNLEILKKFGKNLEILKILEIWKKQNWKFEKKNWKFEKKTMKIWKNL